MITQEAIELLMLDVAGRIPYGLFGRVFAEVFDGDYDINSGLATYSDYPVTVRINNLDIDTEEISVIAVNDEEYELIYHQQEAVPYTIDDFMPYLRPMNSMTEEEKRKFVSIMNGSAKMTADEERPKLVFDKTIAIRENGVTTVLDYNFEAFDWLQRNRFDFRGLIEKGLAMEAPKDMYNY